MPAITGPTLSVDLERIERNARVVVRACSDAGISVFGVTKGTRGMPQVARAMLRGGVAGIGESRFENIRRLRDSGIDCPVMLLRSPPLSRIEEVIRSVDISLNSELAVLRELSRVAERMGRIHDVILMIDLGDLREGIWPDDLESTVEEVIALPGLRIVGVGTNLTCFGAVLPSEANMGTLLTEARKLRLRFGLDLAFVSGGNSSSLPLLLAGRMPPGITNLRIGEAILQGGRDTFMGEPWKALDRDAFLLTGELLEVKVKPSVPIGETGVDAFGRRPVFEDRGERLRGILNIGREDVTVEGLTPVEPGIAVLGASSDHLVVDLEDADPPPEVGGSLSFRLSYGALLAAMTSEYVEKRPMRDVLPESVRKAVHLQVEPDLMEIVKDFDVLARIERLGFSTALSVLHGKEAPFPPDAALPVHLGEDHRTTERALLALARSVDQFGLVWFDARPGLLPAEGFPPEASVLTRLLTPGPGGLPPRLSPENVVLVGLRDVLPLEAEAIKSSRLTVFTMVEIDALGMREIIRQALKVALAGTQGVHVSYVSAVTDIPGTAAGSGGITIRETHQAMEGIAASARLLGFDAVGLSSDMEPRIAAESVHFLLSCLGKRIL
ncbi:MAG: alanine racemase [Parvibaculaceae bacterium]